MRNKFLQLIALLALCVCMPLGVQATNPGTEDAETLRFGNAGTPTRSVGIPGTADTGWFPPQTFDAGAAIWLNAEQRTQYAGTTVSTLEFYHGLIRDESATTITVFVRNGLNGEDIFSDVVTGIRQNSADLIRYEFENPLTIEPSDEPLVFGWYIHITNNVQGNYSTIWAVDDVRDAPSYNNDAIKLVNGEWKMEDNHGYYGNLCIWLKLQNKALPKNDVSLHSLDIPYSIRPGSVFDYKFKITNHGTNEVANISVQTTVGDGTPAVQELEINPALAYGATAECTLKATYPDAGVVQVAVAATKVNGVDDTAPHDNSLAEYMLSLPKDTKGFERNVLIEESGSTGCTWCPRGIVGMNTMKETYGGDSRLILLSAHEADPMSIDTYKQFSHNFVFSLPTATIDRALQTDPAFENLNAAYKSRLEVPAYSKLALRVAVDKENRQATLTSDTEFFFDDFGARYKIAYVIVEDNVGPYPQLNGYSQADEYMGGFENLDDPCLITFDDVAVCSTEAMGTAGIYPERLKAGETYTHTQTLDFPEKCKIDDCRYIAYLIDARTNAIENAAQAKAEATGIGETATDGRDMPVEYYSLQGLRVDPSHATTGIYIRRHGSERTKVVLR